MLIDFLFFPGEGEKYLFTVAFIVAIDFQSYLT